MMALRNASTRRSRLTAQGAKLAVAALSIATLSVACAKSGDTSAGAGASGGAGGSSPPACTAPNEVICDGDVALTCDSNGQIASQQDCGAAGLICDAPMGCRVCSPGKQSCDDGVARQCNDSGDAYAEFDCSDAHQGLICEPDGCKGVCAPGVLAKGNVGCDFFPTVTKNSVWRDWFGFAVVVANTSNEPAEIHINRGALDVATATVAGNSAQVIELPWVLPLKGGDANPQSIPPPPTASVLEPVGAYRLRSNRPVSVYQFSALRYENPAGETTGCPMLGSNGCFSYTNDASILLPVQALTANYTVIGHGAVSSMQEFVAVTATRADTVIEVRPSTSLMTGDGIAALGAGDVGTFTLGEGDVLQLFTSDGVGASLSGTQITAPNGEPLQLLSGIPAANIPDSSTCCSDHIEEIVPPVETLGQSYIVSMPRTPDGGPEPVTELSTVRVHAMFDGTSISFHPPVAAAAIVNQGDVIEIAGLTTDVEISGDQPIAVTQYMHGTDEAGAGDPSQAVAIPTEQFRDRYVFAAPQDYDLNRVNVMAPTGASITLDGAPIPSTSFVAVGLSGYGVAKVPLSAQDIHTIEGDAPFGIMVYGYGAYTSYMYPGGMQLEQIAEVPPVK